jgi:hypothetical protein
MDPSTQVKCDDDISLHAMCSVRGTRWRSWFRHYASIRQVAGSIPDGIIGIFHLLNPSGRTMALESTQPLTEMSTSPISWGVKAACITTLPSSYADLYKFWEPQPPGALRLCLFLSWDCCTILCTACTTVAVYIKCVNTDP